MTSTPAVLHHLLSDPAADVTSYCGAVPGRDPRSGRWHATHDRDLLIECLGFGLYCCGDCLSPEALGGWTPMIIEDSREQEQSGLPKDQWWIDPGRAEDDGW